MSLIRLVMLDKTGAESGLLPSRSIPTVILAISKGSTNIKTFWKEIQPFDPSLHEHFKANQDHCPLLEGIGDGLLVISWEYHCIESFQEFQPVSHIGTAVLHNGFHSVEESKIDFELTREWNIVDHHFEEKM